MHVSGAEIAAELRVGEQAPQALPYVRGEVLVVGGQRVDQEAAVDEALAEELFEPDRDHTGDVLRGFDEDEPLTDASQRLFNRGKSLVLTYESAEPHEDQRRERDRRDGGEHELDARHAAERRSDGCQGPRRTGSASTRRSQKAVCLTGT